MASRGVNVMPSRHLRLFLVALAILVLTTPAPTTAQATEAAPVDFQRDVRPILADNCFQCHGPDEAAREAVRP